MLGANGALRPLNRRLPVRSAAGSAQAPATALESVSALDRRRRRRCCCRCCRCRCCCCYRCCHRGCQYMPRAPVGGSAVVSTCMLAHARLPGQILRQSESIRVHQRPSESIRGHQHLRKQCGRSTGLRCAAGSVRGAVLGGPVPSWASSSGLVSTSVHWRPGAAVRLGS